MLWDGGTTHEAGILAGLPGVVADLREMPLANRFAATVAAMDATYGVRSSGSSAPVWRPTTASAIRTCFAASTGGWFAGDVNLGSAHADDGHPPMPSSSQQGPQILDRGGTGNL